MCGEAAGRLNYIFGSNAYIARGCFPVRMLKNNGNFRFDIYFSFEIRTFFSSTSFYGTWESCRSYVG